MSNPVKIIQALRPGARFNCSGFHYDGLEWLEPPVWEGGQKKPTREEWESEGIRQDRIAELSEYKTNRMLEYPPIVDYIDGIVKGDTAQVQAYIDKCNEIKAKYPRPAELDSL